MERIEQLIRLYSYALDVIEAKMYDTELEVAYGVKGSLFVFDGLAIAVAGQLPKIFSDNLGFHYSPDPHLISLLRFLQRFLQERSVLLPGYKIKHENTRRTGTQHFSSWWPKAMEV